MSQSIGGNLPPHIPNLTMMTAAYQSFANAPKGDSTSITNVAKDALNQIGVFPVPPISPPGDDNLGTPGQGGDAGEVEEKLPPDDLEGHRFLPLLPKDQGRGASDVSARTARRESEFDGGVLKVAGNLLPEKAPAKIDAAKIQHVEKVAEAVETTSGDVLGRTIKESESIPAQNKFTAQLQEAPVTRSDKMSEIRVPTISTADGASSTAPTNSSFTTKIENSSQMMLIAPPKGIEGTPVVLLSPQENAMAIANAALIPLQTSMTKEGAAAILEIHPEHHHAHDTHHDIHHHTEELSVPTVTSADNLQGLTIALTEPLGLMPILPAHLSTAAEAIKNGHEEHAIGGVMHRSLHHEKPLPAMSGDNTPILIPSDNPNLHRVPDGRELMYIMQMAVAGGFRGKKVSDGAFKLGDGMKLDPGYRFGDLLTLAYFASLCGAGSLTQVGAFIDEHEEWVRSNFDMRRGVPSPLIFAWLFSRIKPYYFTKIVLQHIECITDRKRGRQSPFNSIRMWETNEGLIFGHSKEEAKAPSQSKVLRLFDWTEATLILEPAKDPEDVRRELNCRLLLAVDQQTQDALLKDTKKPRTKTLEWDDGAGNDSTLELALYPQWTVGKYKRVQGDVLKVNRTYFSNLPLEFSHWSSLFYPRMDIEEQTVWSGEARFVSLGEVTVSHALDNFDLLRQVAYRHVLEATTLTGSVEQKRQKFWEDPDELLIMIHY
jgi:hypothetical protein